MPEGSRSAMRRKRAAATYLPPQARPGVRAPPPPSGELRHRQALLGGARCPEPTAQNHLFSGGA
eukprot:12646831-Alexandrium_andersonii.AAC.1